MDQNGTYSVRNGALYIGDDFDTDEKTYQVWEDDDPATNAVEGAGRIALESGGEAGTPAQLVSLVMESDRLRFERWHRGDPADRLRPPGVHPINIESTTTGKEWTRDSARITAGP